MNSSNTDCNVASSNENSPWLNDLNEDQKRAVLTENNLCLLASAGSGKTKTIISYIVYRIFQKKTHPNRIVAATFTRKAAFEMQQRILECGAPAPQHIGTFHGIMANLLRYNSVLSEPYREDFNVLRKTSLIRIVMREVLNSLDVDERKKFESHIQDDYGRLQIQNACSIFLSLISALKSDMVSPERYEGISSIPKWYKLDFSNFAIKGALFLLEVFGYDKYETIKRNMNVMDVDDLLYVPVRNMRDNRNLRKSISRNIDYVVVDEDQDCSKMQVELARYLSESGILVRVGDDGQSIYSWRGGNVSYIRQWAEQDDVTVIKLLKNYRSSAKIVNLANEFIKQDPTTLPKVMKAAGRNHSYPTLPVYKNYRNDREEVNGIVGKIADLLEEGIQLNDIAILTRGHFLAEKIYNELLINRIPSRYERSSFFERKIVQFYTTLMSLVMRPNDYRQACVLIADLFKIEEMKCGIGEKTIDAIVDAIEDKKDLIEGLEAAIKIARGENSKEYIRRIIKTISIVNQEVQIIDVAFSLKKNEEEYVKRYQECFNTLGDTIGINKALFDKTEQAENYYNLMIDIHNDYKINNFVSEEHIDALREFGLKGVTRWNQRRIMNEIDIATQKLRRLENLGQTIETIRELLKKSSDFDGFIKMSILGSEASDVQKNAISISTIHSSKGLEWDYLFCAGFDDYAFFGKSEEEDDDAFYEGVRMAYVAVTRAKKEIQMSWASYPSEKINSNRKERRPNRLFVNTSADVYLNDDPANNLVFFKQVMKKRLKNLRVFQ